MPPLKVPGHPWRHKGCEPCQKRRSKAQRDRKMRQAAAEGRVFVAKPRVEHSWRHEGCEPCRLRRNEYSRRHEAAKRRARGDRELAPKLGEKEWGRFVGVGKDRCQVCGEAVRTHPLLRCRL